MMRPRIGELGKYLKAFFTVESWSRSKCRFWNELERHYDLVRFGILLYVYLKGVFVYEWTKFVWIYHMFNTHIRWERNQSQHLISQKLDIRKNRNHPRPSESIRGHPSPSKPIRGHQSPSEHTLRWGMPGMPVMPNESFGMPEFDNLCTESDSRRRFF